MKSALEYEATPRVERIEQQILSEWKAVAGKPMQITYYATRVNTFRNNPDLLRPSDSFTAWATKELRREMKDEGSQLSDADLKAIVGHEWRTDLTRHVLAIRLSRHDSKDGLIVRRSRNGALYMGPHPAHPPHSHSSTKLTLDAIATP